MLGFHLVGIITNKNIELSLWQRCIQKLRSKLTQQKFSQFISPLQVEEEEDAVIIYAPNQFVHDEILKKYLPIINLCINDIFSGNKLPSIVLRIGTKQQPNPAEEKFYPGWVKSNVPSIQDLDVDNFDYEHNLTPHFTFDNYVLGKSNLLASSAARKVAENPGRSYNPLLLYGGVGLGKTHLVHAIGNYVFHHKKNLKVVYLNSEKFVADMVKALQNNALLDFQKFYRSIDVLLIDDVQFFSGKERTQEEFFHTFNSLFEGNQQIVITADKYPKEILGLEERLKSRFNSGLSVMVQPPGLETRVAILIKKAEGLGVALTEEVAFLIAKKIPSNVRELEGALKRVVANAQFTGCEINIPFVHETLSDIFAIRERFLTIEYIIKTVCEYYKIKLNDLISSKRDRKLARPRQIAMCLCKELTNYSLPEIGHALGGRDHTTVIHAYKQINSLRKKFEEVENDYSNLMQILVN